MADTNPDGPKLTIVGKLVILLVAAASFYGAYYLFIQKRSPGKTDNPADPSTGGGVQTTSGGAVPASIGDVEIGLAYGTEKESWIKPAVDAFGHTAQGAHIKINLIPVGSIEGEQAIVRGDADAKKINVWSPASSIYKDTFVQDWQAKGNGNPILSQDTLALTPMVFVFWEARYRGFIKKYGEVSFKTIGQAMNEPEGWKGIAGEGGWGFFKFSHTFPTKSNSGLMTLLLMAYDFHDKTTDLTVDDVVDGKFQAWLNSIEHGIRDMGDSTGTMMNAMVLKGPSSYDCVCLYENVAIDLIDAAAGRWGPLHVIYPRINAWNDNPYYILDVPWSTPAQRQAAQIFHDYLMSEEVQKQSLVHGFRPGNPKVPVKFPDSPWVKYESLGLKVDIDTVAEPPKAEVLNNLLAGWQRERR